MRIYSTFLVLGVLAATPLQASLISYTEQATATGTLGSSSFTNASVTVTDIADATNAQFLSNPGIWVLYGGTTTVTIAGIGSAIFTNATYVFDNPSFSGGAAGIADEGCIVSCGSSSHDILGTLNSAFSSYGLTTPIGPLSGTADFGVPLGYPNSASSNTNRGVFAITAVSGNSTFTATTVPEPSTVLLSFVGAMLIYSIKLKRARVA